MCCPLVLEFSVGIGGFVIGLSQTPFFFSLSSVRQIVGEDTTLDMFIARQKTAHHWMRASVMGQSHVTGNHVRTRCRVEDTGLRERGQL